MLLNIALIIALAVYMKRFNNAKKKCNRNYDILKENTSIEINHKTNQ